MNSRLIIVMLAVALTACKQPSSTTTSPSAASAAASSAGPASAPRLTITRFDGGSVVTELGYGIKLNKGSSLNREWFVITDSAAPAKVDGRAGVVVRYARESGTYSGHYQYAVDHTLTLSEPLTAVELRVHLFDIFGRSMEALRSVEVVDMSGTVAMKPSWRARSENEASETLTSVVYVAQARTAAGKLYSIDRQAVLEQLKAISARISDADLDPKPSK